MIWQATPTNGGVELAVRKGVCVREEAPRLECKTPGSTLPDK